MGCKFAKMVDRNVVAARATPCVVGCAVAVHAHGPEGMKRAVLAGVDSIEHGTLMNDEIIALMKERGTYYVPTISAGKWVLMKAKEDEDFLPSVVRPKAAAIGPQIQQTFIKAYRKIDTYNSNYKFFNWLYRITVNESINYLNRQKRTRELPLDLPSGQPTPEDDFALTEISHLLQKALMAMAHDHRVVIVLKHLLLLSYREIAEILDIPEKTVKSRLFTARQILKKQLAKQGYAG